MAKKKNDESLDTGKEFMKFWKALSPEDQKMLDALGINSFPKLMQLSALMGIDFDKMERYAKEHKDVKPEDVPFEEFMLSDEDNPFAGARDMIFGSDEEDDDDEEELDPFELPDECFIGDKCVEYHLRIKLNNAPLPIWREFKVPSNVTLEFLSFIINDLMGWEGVHLHEFKQKDTLYKNTACLKQDADMGFFFDRVETRDTNDYTIADLLKEKGDRIKYEYDFGDSWEHDLWLKGTREYSPEEPRGIVVVKGTGACPPEDCGGVWGYGELLELSKKKRKTADDKEQLKWYGIDKSFDPEEFDIEFVQDELEGLWYYVTEE